MSDDLPQLAIGAFVESSANDFGIGKVVGVDGVNATIEYFDAPEGTGLHEYQLALATLKKVNLETHTRVFVKNDGLPSWTMATLVWHINSNARVIFPGPREENVPASRIYVRSNKPIRDPTLLLANHIVESTAYAQARRRFLKLMSQQKVVADGMHCLLSSAVDLEHHQVEVVRRVLRDPVQRYLLGDEVGLGKTIEAGLLIRQHIHDHPIQHRVLVIVPKPLMHQWKYELRGRFGLHSELHKTVQVIEVSKLHELESDFKPTMVVIDEAHQVAALYRGDASEVLLFEAVRKLALAAPCLLMLTATPLLHNERDYLTMLHLLDPGVYRLDDIEGFNKRVAQRQAIAEACFLLRLDTPNGFLSDAVQQIQDHLPLDPLINETAARLRARLDVEADETDPERNEAIHALRTHLSEVYKLHRRLLRNRRVGELKAVTPGRAGLNRVVYSDPQLLKLFEALERWRDYVASEVARCSIRDRLDDARSTFAGLLSRCFELGYGLESFVCHHIANSLDNGPNAASVAQKSILFEGEQSLLNELIECAAAMKSDARANALADHIAKNLQGTSHWVIFCTEPSLADKLCMNLRSRFGVDAVLRHGVDDTHWRKFYFEHALALLVCDMRAEEGLNLQGREAVLVHFDLPFAPGRIEQRMGRLDRFGKGKPVRTVVLCADDNPWEESWLSLLNEGLNVFRESIASLQYSTTEWINRGTVQSFRVGSDGWSELASQLAGEKGEVAQEKRRIAEQDAMDLMDLAVDAENSFVDRLRALEKPDLIEAFSQAVVTWAKEALSIKMFDEDRNRPGVFRLVFFEDWTLIPRRLFKKYFAGAVDTSYRPPTWAQDHRAASRPMSFNRRIAQERRSLVARYGEKFLDSLYDWTRHDDRGTCFALWRSRRRMPKNSEGAYIRLEFVVQADETAALAAAESTDSFAIKREADALLPPLHRGIWLDADQEQVSDPTLLALLNAPLLPPSGPGQDGDFDLDRNRWTALSSEAVFRDWSARLKKSLQVARALLPNLSDVQQHVAQSKKAAEARLRNLEFQMKSRLAVLPDDIRIAEAAQFEKEFSWRKALVDAISKPRIVVDSVGAIVLDRRSFTR